MAEFKNELILQDASGVKVSIDLRNALVLSAAPTSSTAARVGMQAYVVSGGVIAAEYVCTAVSGSTYTWVKREISGGTVDVDATLTQSGMAADAKAVGDAIGQLSGEIANANPYSDIVLTSQQGQACREFAALFGAVTGDADSFLFFTDPHTIHTSGMLPKFYESLNQIASVYHSTPVSTCICGGDWLNDSNQRNNACWVLGGIDGAMKRRFDDYLLIVGNHDTNYQGYEYMQSGTDGTYDRNEHTKCILSNETIRSLWHRDEVASYFTKKIDSGTCYVFDTGIDWYPDMDEYRWEQIDWFAEKLLEEDPTNCAGLLHIPQSGSPFIDYITQIGEAFNAKSSITLNDKTYDFSGTNGKFRFIIAGHTHKDAVNVVNTIPVVVTKNLQAASEYSFDLMLADYTAKTLYIVRVGDGENRTVEMADSVDTPTGNLFDIGDSYEDYEHPSNMVSIASLDVNRLDGSLTGIAQSGGTMAILRRAVIDNAGTAYRFRATYTNAVELPQPKSAFIRLFDENGEIVSTWSGGWTYIPAYSCFRKVYEGAAVSSDVEYLDETFTLPENVKTFQVGFQFMIPTNGAANTLVTIRDILLEKI
jgi:hypothetical protein